MKEIKLLGILLGSVFFYLLFGSTPNALAAEAPISSYVILDMGGITQKQQINVYNQGRLETQILQDNSIIQYSYDRNGNLKSRSKGYSSEPYVLSTSAVSYDVYLKGVPDTVSLVRFPTWTEQNGQDDIEWIIGEKVASGLWKGSVVISKHGGIGTYITHVYADQKSILGISAQVKDTVKIVAPQTASLVDGFYEVYVEGVARTVQEVRFPSWTEYKGQDDLENPWITGEKVNDTTWKIRVPFSKHNFETGNYFTHIYSYDKSGTLIGTGGTTIVVNGGTTGPKEPKLSSGSYDVFIYGVDPSAQRVQFPTWTANKDQDDIEWIDGVKIANGVWKATVFYSKHNTETGIYISHIYADGKYVGTWNANVIAQ